MSTPKMRIEFGELRIGQTARKNLAEVCDSNWASGGVKVQQFEAEWNKLFNYGDSVAVSSGTDACINACLAIYDINKKTKRGDEVIVPALSFIATSNAVLAAGLTPVFVDINQETLNIDETLIESAITPKTRAIMVVHTMGKICKMDVIQDIALRHNLVLIEDCCEAHGGRYKGQFVGSFGHLACFSFYIAHLICCGEGGMVSCASKEIGDIIRSTRSHGRLPGSLYFDHIRTGFNSKMNDLEASIGLEGISEFHNTFFRRKNNLYFLMNKLSFLKEHFYINTEDQEETSCPHGFSITMKPCYHHETPPTQMHISITDLSSYLESKGIKCKRNFGCIPTKHRAFAFMGHKLGDFPNAEWVGDNGIHFGVHQYLTQEDLEYIVETIRTWYEKQDFSRW